MEHIFHFILYIVSSFTWFLFERINRIKRMLTQVVKELKINMQNNLNSNLFITSILKIFVSNFHNFDFDMKDQCKSISLPRITKM